MICGKILSQIRKQIYDVSVLNNGDFYCYARDDSTLREIYAIIENFNGDVTEFDVILKERNPDLTHSKSFDDIDKFVIVFKKIIDDLGSIDEIAGNLMFF